MTRVEHEPSIQHFSHPHPLLLINPQNLTLTTQCSGCELQSSGWMYSCALCNFNLHLSCTQMPQLINHPSHPSHPLTLLPTPPYPSGAFTCNGCSLPGRGFCFHCNQCNFDLHIRCTTKPLSLMIHIHGHKLELMFDSPYKPSGFCCDICHQIGSNHWLYHCNLCEFDAHLDCVSNVTNVPQPQTQTQIHMQHYNSLPAGGYHEIQNGTFRPGGVNNFVPSQSMGMYQNSQVGRPGAANGNVYASAAVQGFVSGALPLVGRYFMGDGGGGGGDGDNAGDSSTMGFGSSTLGGFFNDSSS